jgi:PAS domain S-box-containing protein
MLAENSIDVIVRSGFDGTRHYVSPACRKLFGYSPEELLGKPIYAVIHPDDLDHVRHELALLQAHNTEHLCTYRVRRKDGGYVWCETAFRPLCGDGETTPTEFLATVRDITARKAAQDTALEAMEVATQANQAKSLFLASMSHELRTPLNAIIGFGEMLRYEFKGPLSARQAEYVGHILHGSNILLNLVRDILDFASIDAGPMRMIIEPVVLDEVLDELETIMAPLAIDKSVEFRIDRSPPRPPPVMADRRRLAQVLTNLASNAIKYNRPAGSVAVTWDWGKPGWIDLSVADTGIGIPADKQAAVFEPFNRIGAEAGTIEGTGIGLAICQRVIDAMMGRISVTSEVGIGSRFTVSLPVAAAAAAGRADAEPSMARCVVAANG